MNTPDISVIMTTFNSSAFLHMTVDSILNQTLENFEIIIMDDGSTDTTLQTLASYKDPRIHFFSCKHARINNLNQGINLARGKYIARIDHDDLMTHERLEKQYNYMEKHTEIAVCGSWMETFGNEERLIPTLATHAEISAAMVAFNPIANPTSFIRKAILDKYHIHYHDGFSFAEDYQMWTEIVKVGKLANIQEVLLKYRSSDGQTTNRKIDEIMEKSYLIRQNLIENYYSRLKPGIGRFRLKQFNRYREAFQKGEISHDKYFHESYIFFREAIAANLLIFNYND